MGSDHTKERNNAIDEAEPQVSSNIKEVLQRIRPFQKQLEQQRKTFKKLESGKYFGPVNIFQKPSGYGKFYGKDDSLFVGQFSNGSANGKGVYIKQDGSYFEGDFSRNRITKGFYHTQDFTYEGQFKENLFDGFGRERNIKENIEFWGTFRKGKKMNGKCKWRQDKVIYTFQGDIKEDGSLSDTGKLIEQPYGIYQGPFKGNLKHGRGKYEYFNGIKFEGQYRDGKKDGHGILYNGNGTVSYEGEFKDGIPHGKGKAYDLEGKPVSTEWIEGVNVSLIEG